MKVLVLGLKLIKQTEHMLETIGGSFSKEVAYSVVIRGSLVQMVGDLCLHNGEVLSE